MSHPRFAFSLSARGFRHKKESDLAAFVMLGRVWYNPVMFGYVKPNKPELKVKELNLYRGYYCGLCKTMRSLYGIGSRFLLNYDCTFAAILADALIVHDANTDICVAGRCDFLPLQRKYPIVKRSKPLEFAATMNVLLAYNKFIDDKNDDKSLKALGGIATFGSAAKKAAKRSPDMDNAIKSGLNELDKLEKGADARIDLPANTFGELLKGAMLSVTDFIEVSPQTLEILSVLSYNLGKWIYFIDAWSDREKDARSRSYNPFNIANTTQREADMLLALALREANAAFDLLPVTTNASILSNILADGCRLETLNALSSNKERTRQNNTEESL